MIGVVHDPDNKPTPPLAKRRAPGDYNGDGVTDIATYRPSDATWHIRNVTPEPAGVQHGWGGDVPVPGDYNGDGVTDIATYRPSDATWHIRNVTPEPAGVQHGWGGDVPVIEPFPAWRIP